MSYLTAIFQAIAQAITSILPISESGHSAIFHDFAARYSGSVSQLTGVVHIGIMLGIIIVFRKFFLGQAVEFFGGFIELFTKKLSIKDSKPKRHFMYMTCVSLAMFIVLAVPLGKGKNIYSVTRSLSYNGTLLDEGIFFALFSALLFVTFLFISKGKETRKKVQLYHSFILGAVSVISVCFAGLSPLITVFCAALLLGFSRSNSLRYAISMYVPILGVGAIVELSTAVTKAEWLPVIIALIISAAVSFFVTKLLMWIINNNKFSFFAYYDATAALVCIVTGIIELAVK